MYHKKHFSFLNVDVSITFVDNVNQGFFVLEDLSLKCAFLLLLNGAIVLKLLYQVEQL